MRVIQRVLGLYREWGGDRGRPKAGALEVGRGTCGDMQCLEALYGA